MQHSVGCGSSNSLTEVLQQHSASSAQAAASTPLAYSAPPRSNRQANLVLQNPFFVGSITDQQFTVSNPSHASSQPSSCKTVQVGTPEQLPDPVFKQQQWLIADSPLLTPLAGSSVVFRSSGDVKVNAQH